MPKATRYGWFAGRRLPRLHLKFGEHYFAQAKLSRPCTAFIDHMEGNEDIFDRLMNDPEFRYIASNDLMRDIYHRLKGN